MDLADRLALHEMPGRYGDLIDDRDWDGLATIFTDDATFEIPGEVLDGLEGIRAFMRQSNHPRTHAMTNVYADATPDDPNATSRAVVRFRIIGMRRDGRIMSGRYRDDVVRTPEGWRVQTRVFTSTPYEET
ncbi:MAG: nuclear transport factor 2 family protein [Acidimicrobiia bacterium]